MEIEKFSECKGKLNLEKFKKYPERLLKFIEKINNSESFETIENRKIFLDTSNIALVKNAVDNDLKEKIVLKLKDQDQFIKLTSLKKTEEFGGEVPGKRTRCESIAMNQLRDLIKNIGKPINIVVKRQDGLYEKYENINNVEKSKENVKADFCLISHEKPVCFISHKKGIKPFHFLQYAGISDFLNNLEISMFSDDLKKNIQIVEYTNNEFKMKRNVTVGRKIQNNILKRKAIFGKNYSDFDLGNEHNVDFVAQGIFSLNQIDQDTYELNAHHILCRKGFQDKYDNGYEPVLIARYGGDRDNLGIKYARVSIYPEQGRTATRFI